jgi:hypothetical protein
MSKAARDRARPDDDIWWMRADGSGGLLVLEAPGQDSDLARFSLLSYPAMAHFQEAVAAGQSQPGSCCIRICDMNLVPFTGLGSLVTLQLPPYPTSLRAPLLFG